MKAQSSIEYLMVVGVGLTLAAPFIVTVQSDVIDVTQQSENSRFTNSLDRMKDVIEKTSVLGEPAQRTFTFNVPDSVVNAEVVDSRYIIYTRNVSGQATNYTRIIEPEVNSGGLPQEAGSYRVEVEAWRDQVNLSYNN